MLSLGVGVELCGLANITAARKHHGSIEAELWPIEVLYRKDFRAFFCSYKLDLDRMTYVHIRT